jgi:hypothetical protein
MAKPMRRRTRGLGFTSMEVNCLLDAVEKYLPIGDDDWNLVARQHRRHDAEYRRNKTSLKRKFASLYLTRPSPAGDQDCPLEVLRARSLCRRIRNKIRKEKESAGAGKQQGQSRPDGTAQSAPAENRCEGVLRDEGKEERERDMEPDESQSFVAPNIPRTIFVTQERRQEQQVVEIQPRTTNASLERCDQNTTQCNDIMAKKMRRMMNKIAELEEQIEEERHQRVKDKEEFLMLAVLLSM